MERQKKIPTLWLGFFLKIQTTINGKHKNFTHKDLIQIAEKNGIKHAEKIIEEVIQSLLNWEKLANQNMVRNDYKEHVQDVINHNINIFKKNVF